LPFDLSLLDTQPFHASEIDFLTEAEAAFAPPEPKKAATKRAKAKTAPIKAAQNTAGKNTAKKQVAA
jgi:hypothetical protein